MATTLGRSIGVAYQLYHLFWGKSQVRFNLKQMLPDWAILRSLVNIAWPATLQFLIGSGSWILLASLVVKTGHSEASAGYQIGIRVIMFFLLPAWGMSNAAATLVGQNLGAGQPERAALSVMRTAKYNAIFTGLVSVFFLVFAEMVIGWFTQDPAVARYAVDTVRIFSVGYVFYGIGMVMINAFNGAGDTRTPTVINFFGFWCCQIPLAWLLATQTSLGPIGVFIAVPVAETLIAVVAWILFKRGRWKNKKI
jgi:putative MATE family efflux protein